MKELRHDLGQWDGKSVADISKIYENYSTEPSFVSDLLILCMDEALSAGSSWLIKHHIENGGQLTNQQGNTLLTQLPHSQDWETKLHILQILSRFDISPELRQIIEPFLRDGMSDTNKLVKAWCYNGLYELSVRNPELQIEVLELLKQALLTEPASVKARVRNLLKKGF